MRFPTNIATLTIQAFLLVAGSIPTAALAVGEGEPKVIRVSGLTGTVRNSIDGKPVNKATLLLRISEGHWDSTQSDAQGKFSFDSLPPQGSSSLKCTAPGYAPFSQVILYPSNQQTVWDVNLKPSSTNTLLRYNIPNSSPGSSEGSFLAYRGSQVRVFVRTSQSASMRIGYTPLGRTARQR